MSDFFTAEFKAEPFWWERTKRPALPDQALPAKADVAVIGSGYTGLAAALVTARGGRDTLVLDAEDAGWGCSTRNGGQISTSIKSDYAELARRHGPERAHGILTEGRNSLAWVADFVAAEKLDCDFRVAGRFHAAHNQRQFEALERRLATPQPKGLEIEADLVPRAEQRRELGTDAYFGGVVYRRHAAVDPARLHQGMLDRVLASGVRVFARCPATALARDGAGFAVDTPKGRVAVRDVIVATNGYTGALTPWLRRRVIPIGSYVIATEKLPRDLMARLMPRGRIVSDTRKVVYYYRAAPDGERIVFGGRVSHAETDPRRSGPLLLAELRRIFPELKETRISHSWCGFIAYTFDELAHLGRRDGLYYAMGYCGSGAGMAGYLGTRIGQQLLGLREGATAFDDLPFQTRPLYYGNPWFLAPSIMYYRWRDRHG
ncbi:MAG: FAD-binding oxidoreductase [Alphaproteobacteria bacterium]|nr:FAD-binding oxidoreductase [Alphaproteobacteria bacterium]